MTTMKFHIKPKRDFDSGPGFWLPGAGTTRTDNYGWVKSGFVVTDGLTNIMPGATWFRTIRGALAGIECLHRAHGDQALFWELMDEHHVY